MGTRDKCPLLPMTAKMDTDACSDVSTDPSLVAAPPSIASASTASTVADRPLSKDAPVTRSDCSFCGAKWVEPKKSKGKKHVYQPLPILLAGVQVLIFAAIVDGWIRVCRCTFPMYSVQAISQFSQLGGLT